MKNVSLQFDLYAIRLYNVGSYLLRWNFSKLLFRAISLFAINMFSKSLFIPSIMPGIIDIPFSSVLTFFCQDLNFWNYDIYNFFFFSFVKYVWPKEAHGTTMPRSTILDPSYWLLFNHFPTFTLPYPPPLILGP